MRFLSEHKLAQAGAVLTIPEHSLFKSVRKVENYFLLTIEVFTTEEQVEKPIEIVVKRMHEYIHPKAKFIDTVVVGTALFHFFAQPVGVEDGEQVAPSSVPHQVNPESSPPHEVRPKS